MGRIVGIDYGTRRTGIAVSDPLGIFAQPLETVPTAQLFEWVKAYVEAEQVDCIVIGMPRKMDGTPSDNAANVTPFKTRLEKALPALKIVTYDERFTSVLAHKAMLDGGVKKMERRDKAMVDRISAAIILQNYMDSQKK